ncbi:efflux transporter outer membrane subunit [Engelhardtia mirabilis]|uniref:Toluene efflux pump outer membrane protein TtgI n=1 Tax=Engelhardtia mirabilis TaxID=2528011 RepID=A0A518BHK6_9BACT|nr:Toluene efflux pump outer membrane protein TtgI precursor [Planctomycetes bacterium Pla133]QDV00793.1 Toluene efflux pump outer membrane protein TtgI precursor [Planctomycetes bacterium Pla86]
MSSRTVDVRALRRVLPPALLLLAACTTVGRDYEPPTLEVSEGWREARSAGLSGSEVDTALWWQRLDDPLLDELVALAVSDGLDLRAALARVREAHALRGVALGERYPAVQATGSYAHSRASENTPFGAFATETDIHSIGIGASWELDLWGRLQRSSEAANAQFEASLEDARAVRVAVAAEIASAYVDLRAFQARLAIARRNVELQEQTLSLVEARFDSGLVSERDVAQAGTNLGSTRARVPALEAGLRAAENRLAVLAGVPPGALAAKLSAVRPIPVPPRDVATGLPAELLRRRPDIRSAERRYAAEVARVGVAEAELYPRFELTGMLGLSSNGAGKLFESSSRTYDFGPSMTWTLFQRGRLRQLVEAQDARADQAAIAWEQTVLSALEETENAQTAFVREQTRREALASAAGQASRAVEAARSQYTEGLSDFQAVLDSERALAELEDQVAASTAAITSNLIDLYRALGGGFEAQTDGTPVGEAD